MLKRSSIGVAIVTTLAMSCVAQTAPAARTVDLTAADGTKLKASYFPSAKPGPGVLLLHQCNKDRKIWDDLVQANTYASLRKSCGRWLDCQMYGAQDWYVFPDMSLRMLVHSF